MRYMIREVIRSAPWDKVSQYADEIKMYLSVLCEVSGAVDALL